MNQPSASGSQTLSAGDRADTRSGPHTDYWLRMLRGAPATLDLPADHARPFSAGLNQGQRAFTLPPGLAASLSQLVASEDATPAMGMLAVFSALLFRYTGNDEFTIGFPVDAAGAPATLVLHADLTAEPSFRTLLQRARAKLLEALDHQPLALDEVARAISPESGAEPVTFFRVLFTHHIRQLPKAPSPEASLLVPGSSAHSPVDLALTISEQGEMLSGSLAYAADLFEAATVERLVAHLIALLGAALAAPDAPVSMLPLLSVADRAQFDAWNQTDVPMDLDCLHRLIAAHVVHTPNAPALVFDGGRLTYAEFDARANQLAHYLRGLGVGPERIVAVSMTRGPQLIITLLGILKAGGAYLPLDPVYPPAHLAYMLSDARPVALISNGEVPAGLFAAWQEDVPQPRVVDLTRDAAAIAGQPTSAPPDEATLDNLAYVIYTSGSTGRPKGVLIEHRTAATYVLGSGLLYEMTRGDRALHFSSVSFDASVDDIFVPLTHGASLVVTEGHGPPDFAALLEIIARHQLTIVGLPTAYWHTWIAELTYSGATTPPSLRLAIIGGEAASGERYNTWRKLAPSVRLYNGYGPTETTVGSAWYVPSPERDEPPGPMAIGRAMPNERAYILDRHQHLAPVGVVGELYIGGAGLARGYHNRPELTAERFVYLPGIEGDEPMRLYRTGDLARWRNDGELLYLGRADQQVKVRGYRIEPGEIEATLRKHPAVQAAVVVTRPDPAGELMLAGYVVLATPGVTPAELRDFLDARLPHYMVPAAIMALDDLPLTPSGKVDRRALPAPVFAEPEPVDDERARTHVEQVLSKLWQELLGRRSIGLDENFFDLGGHSLLAMRMLVRVGNELGVKLPVSVMIHSDTITKLAEVITREGGSSPWSVLVPIQPEGDRPPLFCVHGFPGDVLWFHDLGRCLAPDQPFYGLQSRSLAEGQPHAMSIEQMAAWYIEGMRSVQPDGPYYMCGASYGGLVVYEMARQLRAYGHEVGLAAVLDYDPYMERETLREQVTGFIEDARRIPSWLRYEVAPMSSTDFQGRFQRRLRLALKKFVSLSLGGKKLPVDAADLMHYGAELPLHRRELLIANDYAFEQYEPEPYEGRVTLVACQSRYAVAAATAEQTGWSDLARGGVEVVFVPGSHETMYKPPYVSTLAQRLRELVDAELARRGDRVAR